MHPEGETAAAGGEHAVRYGLAERAASLVGDGTGDAAEATGGGGGPGSGSGLDPLPEADGGPSRTEMPGPSRTEVLPRAEAVASAREAVRRGRERRAPAQPYGAEPGPDADPDPGAVGAPSAVRGGLFRRAEAPAYGPVHEAGQARGSGAGAGGTAAVRERRWLALRERLPLWVQLRCGIELRTLLALAVVLVVAVAFAVHHFWTGRPEAVPAPTAQRAPAEPDAKGVGSGSRDADTPQGPGGLSGRRLVVDVGGKVRKPGIYKLPNGSRVADALEAAGGVRPGTDVTGLNRARRVVDGEQIVAGGAPAGSGAGQGAGGTGTGAQPGGGTAADGPGGGTVSLNSASAEQLETLPGVGPVLAQHIVEFREEHGGFTSVDQLQEVDGIGDRRLADIKPKVSP